MGKRAVQLTVVAFNPGGKTNVRLDANVHRVILALAEHSRLRFDVTVAYSCSLSFSAIIRQPVAAEGN